MCRAFGVHFFWPTLYTVTHKNMPSNFCPYPRQTMADFKNSYTDTLCGKFAIMWLLNIPSYLNCVARVNVYVEEIFHVMYVKRWQHRYTTYLCIWQTWTTEQSCRIRRSLCYQPARTVTNFISSSVTTSKDALRLANDSVSFIVSK